MSKFARVALLAAVSSILVLGFAASAGAQESDPYVGPTPSIAPETTVLTPQQPANEAIVNTEVVNNEVEATPVAEVEGVTLAFTGGDVAALAMIGAVLVGGGALALAARRRTAVPA